MIEFLEIGSPTSQRNCIPAVFNHHLLHVFPAVLLFPIRDRFYVALASYIKVLVLCPLQVLLFCVDFLCFFYFFDLLFWLFSLWSFEQRQETIFNHFVQTTSIVINSFNSRLALLLNLTLDQFVELLYLITYFPLLLLSGLFLLEFILRLFSR